MALASQPTAVVALGGNALLPRGEKPEAGTQLRAARAAAQAVAPAADDFRLVVTHGNGPQVGLLALIGESFGDVEAYPLDVLDAESEGQIGYVVELELDNAMAGYETVALITRVLVDENDPAFGEPSKFIGPVYAEADARALASARGWTVKPDGDAWRRVVPSPEPSRILELGAIRRLTTSGFVVVCAGGGGVPVVAGPDGLRGVEAVIDKDLCSALLARELGAEVLVLATDVDGVYLDWGSPDQRLLARTTPDELRRHGFAAGSMGPKVEAACRFAEAGGRAAIGALGQLEGLLGGTSGTQVSGGDPATAGVVEAGTHEWEKR